METITKSVQLNASHEKAFHTFLKEFNNWWPKAYTWSKESLFEIKIDARLNGLCSEIGPYGFRMDWGRVVELVENEKIHLKWQISPQRVPEPQPEKASDVIVQFTAVDPTHTVLKLEHLYFENHGVSAEDYLRSMAAPEGWDFILNEFVSYLSRKQLQDFYVTR